MSYSKSGNNFLLDIMIAGDQKLTDFLQSRPCDEELGESLEIYEQHLDKIGQLTQKIKDDLRCCHIHYQSDLLSSKLPIKTLSEININEDDKIREFCEDLVYLCNAKLNDTHLRGFANAYQVVDSLYVNYNMAKTLLRYNIVDKAFEFYDKALKSALFSIDKFWNNKESIYACSELIFDIVSSELFNSSTCDGRLLGKILEYSYLLLSRVILWPEDSDNRFDDFEMPITYRHKISSLNKRAEILLKHRDYFKDLTPSYSTPETLSVADYSLAHDLAFIGKQTGLKSLFKRDAKKLYSILSKENIRPFATSITDGKNDSVEMAHRFYKKLKKSTYQLDEKEYKFICNLFKDIINEIHVPINKIDKNHIQRYLLDNDIKYFYHFTERENIESIKRNGGICSLKYCLLNAIEVSTKGDMTLLRDTDASFGLEDYVRLSFCERHPLIKKRQSAGADLVILKIKIDIAWRYDTLYSDRDAASNKHQHGNTIEDLKKVRISAIRKKDLEEWDPDYEFNQAEVMVKSIVPIEYIENIDSPIELTQDEIFYSVGTNITIDKVQKAINTIIFLSDLFRNSSFLLTFEDGRNDKKCMTMYSFASILGYLFEEEYSFGDYFSSVDKSIEQHYAIIKSTLSVPEYRNKAISDLSNNWSSILQTILEIQNSNTEGSRTFIDLQPEIDNVTEIIEIISGTKCRKPTIGYMKVNESQRSQFNIDAFTHLVEEAEYNPFMITTEPTLQNFPPLPNLINDFRLDILNLCNKSELRHISRIQILTNYVYNLIESYYKDAGYVPKNTVDAIIEQCYQAIKATEHGWYIPSLDEMKFKVYSLLFHKKNNSQFV